MTSDAIKSLSPLAADVRSESPDSYLSTLFAPADKRRTLIALYALDNELARIQKIVHEPMAGLIRLQWWDDVVDSLDRGNSIAHPVVTELKYGVVENGLDTADLKRAIDGRRRPFEEDQPSSLLSFQRYLVDVGGSITSAAAKLLGVSDRDALDVANKAGTARAAIGQLSCLEHAVSNRRLWLPSARLDQRTDEHFDAFDTGNAIDHGITKSVAEFGLAELKSGRATAASIGRNQLSAFFPATLAGLRLEGHLRSKRTTEISNSVLTLIFYWLRGRF